MVSSRDKRDASRDKEDEQKARRRERRYLVPKSGDGEAHDSDVCGTRYLPSFCEDDAVAGHISFFAVESICQRPARQAGTRK